MTSTAIETKQDIVVVDFSGTLIKPFVAEEANIKRYKLLGIPLPDKEEHKRLHATKSHYDALKRHIESYFGISDDMEITYVNNFNREIKLKGSEVKTMIMTDLFRNAMYAVAKEHGSKIYTEGILEALQNIKNKGYKLAIVSGIRTDIITGMLAITNCHLRFDYIYGQDPVLSRDDNNYLVRELAKEGRIKYVIGDKSDDLVPAKTVGAKAILLKGGHAKGDEEAVADFIIENAKELEDIVR